MYHRVKQKKGFILINVLVLLMIVGVLVVTLNFMSNGWNMWLDNFVTDEQEVMIKYSLQKNNIKLDNKLEIYNSLKQRFTVE